MKAMELKRQLEQWVAEWEQVQEIRIRVGRPVCLYRNGEEEILPIQADGFLVQEILGIISGHSLYAYEDEIRQGFLTMEGGHRVGICGTAVLYEEEQHGIRTIKDISALNIRLARQKVGCADPILSKIYDQGRLQNTLLISPPGAGKTTLLRDLIRQVSDGNPFGKGQNVSVVDERSELGACVRGVPQCDLGMRTDVLDRCPKTEGMLLMLRSMAPQVMAVDEIGAREDIEALFQVLRCGCRILATIHGEEAEDIKTKPMLLRMAEEGMFSRFVVLTGNPVPGTIRGIYDQEFRRIDTEKEWSLCVT